MSLNIVMTEVRSVLLADGWHTVARGSFRVDTYEFSSASVAGEQPPVWPGGGGNGFEFEDQDGAVVAGPLASLLAVSCAAPERPKVSNFELLAEMVNGEASRRDGREAVQFCHAGMQFQVWVDDGDQWVFGLVDDTSRVWHTGVDADEQSVPRLVVQMMGEIKGEWGTGRAPLSTVRQPQR